LRARAVQREYVFWKLRSRTSDARSGVVEAAEMVLTACDDPVESFA
jgi:hypothetical protein